MDERASLSAAQIEAIELEEKYNAHNYHPLPVVLSKGCGPFLFDIDGKRYFDFLSAYSATNQGHCHPRIVEAMVKQAGTLTLTSRAFYSDKLGPICKRLATTFGYDRALLMNSGAEAVESGLKFARRWAYDVKKVEAGQALVIVAKNNFHGRTTGIISFSSDPDGYTGFGPFMPGFVSVPYNDLKSLGEILEKCADKVAAFLVEPIQGEAGIVVPDHGYLQGVRELCTKHKVLFIADEIQTGIGRTGRMLCSEWSDVKPDMVLLGKALSGGVMPVSAVLTSDEVMLCVKPGQHGSTYGGNPLAAVVADAALTVVEDEKLVDRAQSLGELFRRRMCDVQTKRPDLIELVRGKGLLNGVVMHKRGGRDDEAWQLCLRLRDAGILAKPTHGHIIRFAPALVLTDEQMNQALDSIEQVFLQF